MQHHGMKGWKLNAAEDEVEEDYEVTYNPLADVADDLQDPPQAPTERPLLPAFSFRPSASELQSDSEPSSARPSTSAQDSSAETEDVRQDTNDATEAALAPPQTPRHSHRRSTSITQVTTSEMPRREFAPNLPSPIDTARFQVPASPHRRNNRPEISFNPPSGDGMIDLDAAIPSPETPRSRGRSFSAARQSMHSRGHASISRQEMDDVFEEEDEDADADTMPSSPDGPPTTISMPDLTRLAVANSPALTVDSEARREHRNGAARRHSTTEVADEIGNGLGLRISSAKTKEKRTRKGQRLRHRLLKFLHLRR